MMPVVLLPNGAKSWDRSPYLIEPIDKDAQHTARRIFAMTTALMIAAFLGIALVRSRNQPRQ